MKARTVKRRTLVKRPSTNEDEAAGPMPRKEQDTIHTTNMLIEKSGKGGANDVLTQNSEISLNFVISTSQFALQALESSVRVSPLPNTDISSTSAKDDQLQDIDLVLSISTPNGRPQIIVSAVPRLIVFVDSVAPGFLRADATWRQSMRSDMVPVRISPLRLSNGTSLHCSSTLKNNITPEFPLLDSIESIQHSKTFSVTSEKLEGTDRYVMGI